MNGPEPLTDYERGWLEALIDGEGSLSLFSDRRPHQKLGCSFKPTLAIGSNDRPLVERARTIINAGSIRPNRAAARMNVLWQYTLQSNGLRWLLPQLSLLLKERQRVLLLEALDLLAARNGGQGLWHRDPNSGARLLEIKSEMTRLNRRGRAGMV